MAEEPQHPIQVKAKGKKLVTKSRRLLDNIPPEFKAEAVTRIEKQAVPTETSIDEPFGSSQMGSTVEADNTTQSQKIDEFLDQELPVVLVDSVITPAGQLGTRTRTLDEGIQTLTPDPVQVEGNVDNIGADRSIKTTIVVPEVFPADLHAKERPETIPEKFRAANPLTTTRLDSAGTAEPPTLVAGDVARSSEQTKEGIKRDSVWTRDSTLLPITLLGQEITEEGQLADVTEVLDDAPQTIAPSPTQVDATVENLGNGNTLKTTKVVSEVFDNAFYSRERPNEIIPAKFRAQLPTVTTRLDSAGTAAMPTLQPGDVGRSSEQVREGVKRDTTVARDLDSATSVTGSLTTSEYGGDVAAVTEDIVDDSVVADSGEDVISSEVDAYGDGKATKKTIRRTATDWPQLTEYEYDPRSRKYFTLLKTVVPAEEVTAPTFDTLTTTEYKSLDKWRSIQIVTSIPSDILATTLVHSITKQKSFPYVVDRCTYVCAVKRTNFTTPGSGVVANEVSSFDIALDIEYSGGYSGIVEARLTETFTTNPNATLPTLFKYNLIGGTLCLGYVMSGVAISGASVRTFLIKESLHDVINPDPPTILNFSTGATIAGTITYSGIDWEPGLGIPATDPTTLNSGDWVVDEVGMQLWRAGIYVKSVVEVKVP